MIQQEIPKMKPQDAAALLRSYGFSVRIGPDDELIVSGENMDLSKLWGKK